MWQALPNYRLTTSTMIHFLFFTFHQIHIQRKTVYVSMLFWSVLFIDTFHLCVKINIFRSVLSPNDSSLSYCHHVFDIVNCTLRYKSTKMLFQLLFDCATNKIQTGPDHVVRTSYNSAITRATGYHDRRWLNTSRSDYGHDIIFIFLLYLLWL